MGELGGGGHQAVNEKKESYIIFITNSLRVFHYFMSENLFCIQRSVHVKSKYVVSYHLKFYTGFEDKMGVIRNPRPSPLSRNKIQ